MKIIILISLILLSLLILKILPSRKSVNTKSDTTIDLEEDPKTKEYKPKE